MRNIQCVTKLLFSTEVAWVLQIATFITFGIIPLSCENKSKDAEISLDTIVNKAAEESGLNFKNFFLISNDICFTCLEETIEGTYDKNVDEVNFVMLGANMDDIKNLNAIYGRQRLKFLRGGKDLWNQLVKLNNGFRTGVFIGIKHDETGKLIFYDGKEIPAKKRIRAIVEFVYE